MQKRQTQIQLSIRIHSTSTTYGFSINWGYPNSWMVYKETPIKMDDFGVPPFQETSPVSGTLRDSPGLAFGAFPPNPFPPHRCEPWWLSC